MALRTLCVFGTRPEAIKMAPVVKALAAAPEFDVEVCVTAQHRQMLDQVLDLFGIRPDYDLDLMSAGQDLFDITVRCLAGLRDVLEASRPDLILVQGDTSSCFAGALAAFYKGIAIGHVEAGLRTWDLAKPFPEEGNRVMTGRLANLHFAPTESARRNLLAENVPESAIHVTGNTVIDALLRVRNRLPAYPAETWAEALGTALYERLMSGGERVILVTGHRRESFGQGFAEICQAIRQSALAHPHWLFVYPVHLNPNVMKPVHESLGALSNVRLIAPLGYLPFVWLMDRSEVILTDSGGVQEEAPALGKPVLVMRNETERPEAVEAGTAMLVGPNRRNIVEGLESVLEDDLRYRKMAEAPNPFGDGYASERIRDLLLAGFDSGLRQLA